MLRTLRAIMNTQFVATFSFHFSALNNYFDNMVRRQLKKHPHNTSIKYFTAEAKSAVNAGAEFGKR